MNKKISKITTWLAAAVFLFALAINVKVSLDDPISLLNDKVLANPSSSGTTDFCHSESVIEGQLTAVYCSNRSNWFTTSFFWKPTPKNYFFTRLKMPIYTAK